MIVREKPDAWDLLTALHGSIVPRIIGSVGFVAALAVGVVVMDRGLGIVPRLDGSAFAVFGTFTHFHKSSHGGILTCISPLH